MLKLKKRGRKKGYTQPLSVRRKIRKKMLKNQNAKKRRGKK